MRSLGDTQLMLRQRLDSEVSAPRSSCDGPRSGDFRGADAAGGFAGCRKSRAGEDSGSFTCTFSTYPTRAPNCPSRNSMFTHSPSASRTRTLVPAASFARGTRDGSGSKRTGAPSVTIVAVLPDCPYAGTIANPTMSDVNADRSHADRRRGHTHGSHSVPVTLEFVSAMTRIVFP